MGKLVLHLHDGSTREFTLERERLTIGRRADNDICLPFPAVSAEHAAVVTILDDSFLEDLGSTNGTLVNGKAITKHFLRDLDEIDIGRQTLVYLSGVFTIPLQTSISESTPTIAVTENGGATIGDDEATVVPPARARVANGDPRKPVAEVPATAAAGIASAPEPELDPQQTSRATTNVVAQNRLPSDAPALEVLDGPSAGHVVHIRGDEFVLGRPGVQLAAVRRMPEGFRLLHLEGEASPCVNGAAINADGSLLAIGDEIEIAGTRLLYRSGG
jgi:predicted component of type VI protein secretion system